jgi:hypothetical protein
MVEGSLPYTPPTTYAKVDLARAKRIAYAFESSPNNPEDPEVKAAYPAMIQETIDQNEAILKTGWWSSSTTAPTPTYGNPPWTSVRRLLSRYMLRSLPGAIRYRAQRRSCGVSAWACR